MRSYSTTAFVKQFYPKKLKRATSFTLQEKMVLTGVYFYIT